ncbi:Lrp/AsnC family transcriptional regulator [Candidatus Woesearchaeota archaeon]|nr:Lrp/AsnC family transcriptional regulator [Candidatus Woesearchaeota archaeon]
MVNYKLDIKDRKILYELEINARQSCSQIAKKVGLLKESVNYRIKKLEREKIIEYYTTVVDYVRLGYLFCRMWFKYLDVSKNIENKMIKFARENPNISWIAIGDGEFNMAIVYLVKNLNMIEEDFDNFKYIFGRYIKNIFPSIAFKIYHFKHTYLYNNEDRNPIIVGGASKNVQIDSIDAAILKEFVRNPKVSYIQLSKILKVSERTVSSRVNNLIKRQVIGQFKVKINVNKLGYEHQKVFLYLKNLTRENMQKLISYLRYEPRIIFITKAFGVADLEFEIVVRGKKELFEFVRKLRSEFPKLISDYESFLLYSEPFTEYLSLL